VGDDLNIKATPRTGRRGCLALWASWMVAQHTLERVLFLVLVLIMCPPVPAVECLVILNLVARCGRVAVLSSQRPGHFRLCLALRAVEKLMGIVMRGTETELEVS